jgi:hypothetical protein
VQAEDYDVGGEGVAFHDTTAGNAGGSYRSDDVDLQLTTDTGGGANVGWTDAGEWLEYTVSVAAAGTYVLEARVATPNAGKTFRVEFNGVDRTGTRAVPQTGGWQTWVTVSAPVSLSGGTQVMRLATATGGFNLNWIRVSAPADFTVTLDAVSTGKPCSLSTARVGALPYIDRSYTIGALGSALDGGVMVRTAMDDKYATSPAYLRLTVSAPATVYACMDRRTADPPAWLEDGSWTATASAISTSDGAASPMRVYARSVAAGSFSTGGNHQGGDSGARANYFLVIRPDSGTASVQALGIAEDAWIHEGDGDGDGLLDAYEAAEGLDPEKPDTDGDGEPDEEERNPAGALHWDAQEAEAPASGGSGGGGASCGALGLESLLVLLLRRRR